MKIKYKILIVMIIFITFIYFACTNSYANTTPNFSLNSESAILIDSKTGKILLEKNSNQKMYPASTTKILTAIITLERCALTDMVTASYDAVMSIPAGYSNAAIQPNEVLSVQDLLDMFLIHSANEVGLILAEHISGSVSSFADLMNQKLAEIGCTNTHFTNPSGIHDENHYSTAYDMALIAKYCMKNESFRQIVSKPSCKIAATDKYEERFFANTNDMLIRSSKYYYEHTIGIKTGYTSQAKNCLIAASSKDNLELISVTLGSTSTEDGKSGRYVDTINLFNYGFENYKYQEVISKNSVIKEIVVENATKDTENLQLILKDSISTIINSSFDISTIEPLIEINDNISAPIAEGTVIGKVTYNIDGTTYSSDLIANHNVEKSNLNELLYQIILAILVLCIIAKILSKNNKNNKKKYSKRKNSCDSIYSFL